MPSTPKPRLFIGSSSEAKTQAQYFADELSEIAEVIPWWQAPEFEPMTGTLEALIAAAQAYDFGVFILTPDDAVQSRRKKGHTARDNVLLELGLFLGELGRDRCFAFIQTGPGKKLVRTPSDLAGITIPHFKAPTPQTGSASVAVACTSLIPIVQRKGFRELQFNLVDGWSLTADLAFRMVLSERLIAEHFHRLQDRSLIMVVRRANDAVDRDSDRTVVFGKRRKIPRTPQRVELETPCSRLIDVPGHDRLDAFLYLLPSEIDAEGWSTIDDVLRAGGRLIEARGRKLTLAEGR